MSYYRSYRKKLNFRKVKYEDGNSGVVSKPTMNGGCLGKDKSYSNGDSGIYMLQEIHDEAFNTGGGGGGGGASADPGGVVFTTIGTHSWTCPSGVTSVCVVCIGGGGGGHQYASYSYGGAGGGLGWKNNITVVPGQSYTVVVGAGGSRGPYSSSGTPAAGVAGGNSYFISTSDVCGFGGAPGRRSSSTLVNLVAGGSYSGDGGGSGGNSQYPASYASGGGGAGGYSGNGGASGYSTYGNGSAGSGGGGGGGGNCGSSDAAGGGGGVGIYGEGTSGAGGSGSSSNSYGGGGGSGGTNGTNGGYTGGSGGGSYGGGGGGADNSLNENGNGAQGAVRIIWGSGRSFPSTNVDAASSTAGETTV